MPTDLTRWTETHFNQLCAEILQALGMPNARPFPSIGLARRACFRAIVPRASSDGMFRSEERWLCVFIRVCGRAETATLDAVAQAAIAADVTHLFAVLFSDLAADDVDYMHAVLRDTGIVPVILPSPLADALAADCQRPEFPEISRPNALSFTHLRQYGREHVEAAPWRSQFVSPIVIPARVTPLHAADVALAEADLHRAVRGGSCLLLGEPGAGKSTALRAFAATLAAAGGRTPVYVPLGAYRGDFWSLLGESLAPERAEPIDATTTQALLRTGALVVMLDGFNEVQDRELQRRLADTITELTAEGAAEARCRWVVTGRVHDYQQSHHALPTLEVRRFELQPLTEDAIYQFLQAAAGRAEGATVYQQLSRSVREICRNPLLLTMVAAVYRNSGEVARGRAALYDGFVDLLLRRDDDGSLGAEERQKLESALGEPVDPTAYRAHAAAALRRLADAMTSTCLPFADAERAVAQTLNAAGPQAARLLLKSLIRRGLLRSDGNYRVSFFHHTVQEYFQAFNLAASPAALLPYTGIPAARHEAVSFAIGMQADPAPYITRALTMDLVLAFELTCECSERVPPQVLKAVARSLWGRTLRGGSPKGYERRWAIRFNYLTSIMGETVETLVDALFPRMTPLQRAKQLSRFFGELGDRKRRRAAIERVIPPSSRIPDELILEAAAMASSENRHRRAIDLYTLYLSNAASKDPATARANRAVSHARLGNFEAAIQDYEESLRLQPASAATHANLGHTLYVHYKDLDRAVHHLEEALRHSPSFAPAHAILGDILQTHEPEAALAHRMSAVENAPNDQLLTHYLTALAALQERLGRHTGAMQSLRHLIELDPTSARVPDWRQRIARARQALDEQDRKRTIRDRLLTQQEPPLATLVIEWLKAAGLGHTGLGATWGLATGSGYGGDVAVGLVLDPVVTAGAIDVTMQAQPREARHARRILLVAGTESLAFEAHARLTALQEDREVALVTALQIREAYLLGDRDCGILFAHAFQRAALTPDPFAYKSVVTERTEFFGRSTELAALVDLVGRGQSVGLYGIHKVGKSSLLCALNRHLQARHPNISMLSIVMSPEIKEASDFYAEVLDKLPGLADPPSRKDITWDRFRATLTAYHERRRLERPAHRIVLVMDEYAYLLPDRTGKGGVRGYVELLGLLRALGNEGWLSFLPCGRTAALSRLANLGNSENPFLDLLHQNFLAPLSRTDTDELMQALANRVGLRFTTDGLDTVYEAAGGHPGMSRTLGSRLVRLGKEPVDRARVQAAAAAVLADHGDIAVLRGIYEDRMDVDEQAIARRLALDGPQPRKALFPGDADDARRRRIRDALQNLIDTAVLVVDGDRIAHRFGLLQATIRRQAEELGY